MNEETFTQLLREFIHREPFEPFFVVLTDGRRFLVDYPSVAFSGPAAVFLGKDDLIDFTCDEVRSISRALLIGEVRSELF
jgi:hypothetical protein